MVKVVEVCELQSYAKAAKDANGRKAMDEEMHTLTQNKTWDLVHIPTGIKLIWCKWVYKVKYNADDSVKRYKT